MQNSRHALTPDTLAMLQTIASTGSFAAAARALNMVPSALTYRVRQVEDALDVLLFDRSSRQAKPTAAGLELLRESERLLQDLDAVAILLHNGADTEKHSTGELEATPLIYAIVECGREKKNENAISVLLKLLGTGTNVNQVWGEIGYHAVHAAVMYAPNNEEALKILLEKKPDINAGSKLGHTALHLACSFDNDVCARVLIDAGASVEARDVDGDTPLIVAVRAKAMKVLSLLIQDFSHRHRPDLEMANKYGMTALLYAASEGCLNIVKMLLAAGAKCDIDPNVTGEGFLTISLASANYDAAKGYLEGSESCSAFRQYWDILLECDEQSRDAILSTTYGLVKRLGITSSRESTLLHWASMAGNYHLAERLLAYDTDLDRNPVFRNSWTPLDIAKWRGDKNIQLLLEKSSAKPSRRRKSINVPCAWSKTDSTSQEQRIQLTRASLVFELDGMNSDEV